MKNVLKDHKTNMGTRMKLLEACVRSRLTCGTQTTCIVKVVAIDIEHTKQLRKKNLGQSTVLKISLASPNQNNMGSFVRAQYLKYIGHVCRGSH